MSQKYLEKKYSNKDLDALMFHIETSVTEVSDVESQEIKDGLIKFYAAPVYNMNKFCNK